MSAETEGITLLSMYGEDEEDEEATLAPSEGAGVIKDDSNDTSKDDSIRSDRLLLPILDKIPQILTSPYPLHPKDGAYSNTLKSPSPQTNSSCQPPVSRPQPSSHDILASPSPHLPPVRPFSLQDPTVGHRGSRGALTIVDYAHDEAAMSPEAEEIEIESGGYVLFRTKLQGSDVNSEGTTPVASQTLTPKREHEYLQPSDAHELSKTKPSMDMNCTETERDVGEVETSATVSSDLQKVLPFQKFLPPPVTIKCSEELQKACEKTTFSCPPETTSLHLFQEKINKFLAYKKSGKSYNADLRNRKDYRNPDFLQYAVRYQDIEQIGTCFGTEVFDPHGYDKSEYYDEIEADMKRELERTAQELKRSKKIDFVSGGVQSGGAAPALKMNKKITAMGVSTTVDAARDSRLNKKSKWG